MRPFIRDLDRVVERAADNFEKRMRKALSDGMGADATRIGESVGDKLGAGVDRKMRGKLGDKNASPWVAISSAFASALDNGISSLPAEVKVALVAGIVAALPIVSGALATAVSAGTAAGVAGLGTLLAFQYEQVSERGIRFAEDLRLRFITAASSFVPAVLQAMDTVEDRMEQLGPLLNRIFAKGATFVAPLTEGLLDFLEQFLSGVDDALGDSSGFVQEFAAGLRTLGFALGEVLRILAGTGDSGRKAFRDLVFFVGILMLNLAQLIALLTELYGLVRQIAEVAGAFQPLIGMIIQSSDQAAGATGIMVARNRELTESTDDVVKMTAEEEKRLKDLKKALDDASDATYGIIDSQIDFEESLDRIADALKDNGATLDFETDKGRENAREFLKGLKAAEEETLAYVATGKLSAQQAAQFYDQQIESLRKVAIEGGLTALQFDTLYGDIIKVAELKLDAAAMGIINTEAELSDATKQARELWNQLQRIKSFRLPAQGTRPFSEYADGAVVHAPTVGVFGEAGPEVIIPLTKPQRAAQLLQQSGLDRMFGGGGTTVNVYVGNEQLDARTYSIVEQNNTALSNSVTFGARGL